MDHRSQVIIAIERSHARRQQTEEQLRSLRGTALTSPLAELDSLLVYELQLESRLGEVLNRNMVVAAR